MPQKAPWYYFVLPVFCQTPVLDVSSPALNHSLIGSFEHEVNTADVTEEISTSSAAAATAVTALAMQEDDQQEAGGHHLVEDIEEGEAPGICAVCCQLEPPGFDTDANADIGDSEYQVGSTLL